MLGATFETRDGLISRDSTLVSFPPPHEYLRPMRIEGRQIRELGPNVIEIAPIRKYRLEKILFKNDEFGNRVPVRAWYVET